MVSIIVPVHNVEKYLRRCVDSIIAQTYSEWEALLIDDGSTDSSGTICDEYANRDNRIRCYHKENGGQSSARNEGLEHARGEQIAFCDADDWLTSDFLVICITKYKKYKADIVTANYYNYYNDNKCEPVFDIKANDTVLDNRMAMKRLLENDGTSSSVCARIYNKKIFDNICFENGMLFEDAAISYKLFMNADKVVFVSKPLMYYYHRENSTMARRDKKIRLDEIRAARERYMAVRESYDDEIAEAAISDYAHDMIHVTECFIREGYDLREIESYDKYLRTEIEKHSYHVGMLFSKRKKVELFLWLEFPRLFVTLVTGFTRLLG